MIHMDEKLIDYYGFDFKLMLRGVCFRLSIYNLHHKQVARIGAHWMDSLPLFVIKVGNSCLLALASII